MVLVEPAAIVAAEPTRIDGLRRLYVVLTRAVLALAVVHDEPLPGRTHRLRAGRPVEAEPAHLAGVTPVTDMVGTPG